MKLLKKLTALMIAVALVMTLGITAFAADDDVTIPVPTTVNIKINGAVAGATYNAYRLLNTTVSLKSAGCHGTDAEHSSACYNIGYSANSTYWTIMTQLTGASNEMDVYKYILGLNNADTIYDFAEAVYGKLTETGKVQTPDATVTAGADGTVELKNVIGGYWLIVESIVTDNNNYKGAHSLLMLDTVGKRDITVHTKRDTLTLEKKVQDNGASYGMFADHEIGENAKFWILSDVPDHIEAYNGANDNYKYIIHDKMEAGLTFVSNSVNIHLNTQDGALLYDANGNGTADEYFTVITDGLCTDCDFHIEVKMKAAIKDGVLKASDRLYIYYDATLNSSASVLQTGTQIENANANTAWLEYSHNPYEKDKTTTTTPSSAYVWTFRFDLIKVDHDNIGLNGAKFVLSKDGNLKATELDDINDLPEEKLIPLLAQHATQDEGTTNHEHYHLSDDRTNENNEYVITAGVASIGGFDDQTEYYLYEVLPPEGYNKLNEPTLIKFTASYDGANDTQHFATGYPRIIVGNNAESSTLEARVVNQTGTELPSTGGIGTTIFYVLGGTMVLGAAVLLITKKRMSAEV